MIKRRSVKKENKYEKYSPQTQEIDNRHWNIKCICVIEGDSRDNKER